MRSSYAEQDGAFSMLLAERTEDGGKALFVAASILDDSCPSPRDWSDRAAVARMKEVLLDPKETL